jgi:hypothetical protein
VSGLLSRGWCRWGCRRERRGWGGGGRLGRSKRRAVGEGVGRRGRGGRGCSEGWLVWGWEWLRGGRRSELVMLTAGPLGTRNVAP